MSGTNVKKRISNGVITVKLFPGQKPEIAFSGEIVGKDIRLAKFYVGRAYMKYKHDIIKAEEKAKKEQLVEADIKTTDLLAKTDGGKK